MLLLNFGNKYEFILHVVKKIGYPSIPEIVDYQYLESEFDEFLDYRIIRYYINKAVIEYKIQEFKAINSKYETRYGIHHKITAFKRNLKPSIDIGVCNECNLPFIYKIKKRSEKKHIYDCTCRNKRREDSFLIDFLKIFNYRWVVLSGKCVILGIISVSRDPYVEFPYKGRFLDLNGTFTEYYAISTKLRSMGYRGICVPRISGIPE